MTPIFAVERSSAVRQQQHIISAVKTHSLTADIHIKYLFFSLCSGLIHSLYTHQQLDCGGPEEPESTHYNTFPHERAMKYIGKTTSDIKVGIQSLVKGHIFQLTIYFTINSTIYFIIQRLFIS